MTNLSSHSYSTKVPTTYKRQHFEFQESYLEHHDMMHTKQIPLDQFRSFQPIVKRLSSMTPKSDSLSERSARPKQAPQRSNSIEHAKITTNEPIDTANPVSSHESQPVQLDAHPPQQVQQRGSQSTANGFDLSTFRYENDAMPWKYKDHHAEDLARKRKALLETSDWAGLAPSRPARFDFTENTLRGSIGKRRKITEDDRRRREGHGHRLHIPAIEERYALNGVDHPNTTLCLEDLEVEDEHTNTDKQSEQADGTSFVDNSDENALPAISQAHTDVCDTNRSVEGQVFTSDRSVYEMFMSNPFDLRDYNFPVNDGDESSTGRDTRTPGSGDNVAAIALVSSPPARPIAHSTGDGPLELLPSSPSQSNEQIQPAYQTERDNANVRTDLSRDEQAREGNHNHPAPDMDQIWNSLENSVEEYFREHKDENNTYDLNDVDLEDFLTAESLLEQKSSDKQSHARGLGEAQRTKDAHHDRDYQPHGAFNPIDHIPEDGSSSINAVASSATFSAPQTLNDKRQSEYSR